MSLYLIFLIIHSDCYLLLVVKAAWSFSWFHSSITTEYVRPSLDLYLSDYLNMMEFVRVSSDFSPILDHGCPQGVALTSISTPTICRLLLRPSGKHEDHAHRASGFVVAVSSQRLLFSCFLPQQGDPLIGSAITCTSSVELTSG